MKLEEATAVLRPRSAWEAIDLGCALARRHWGKLMRGWISMALPLWALIALLAREHPGWAVVALWWTKPVLTRQPVFFLSRALFGSPPRLSDFWRNWKSALWRGLPAALTVKRFSFQRSFRLPVITLEGQSGRGYLQRAGILSAHGGSNAAYLSFIGLTLEIAVALGLTVWLNDFMSDGLKDWMDTAFNFSVAAPDWMWWVAFVVYAMAVALIEPMYAAAGFALYINSRTHLEGWDIEVIFRRMSERLTNFGATAACLFLAGMMACSTACAAPAEPEAKAVVEDVLKRPEFELDKRMVRVPKENKPDPAEAKELEPEAASRYGGSSDLRWMGLAVIACVLLLGAWLLWQNRIAVRRGIRNGDDNRTGPKVVMGMDLAPESLPEDVPQTALREFQAGRPLEAMRLLYRGSLAWLVSRAALPVHESDTEGDCLRHSRQLEDKPRVSFFESLTISWINCAYAGTPPAENAMRDLCERWPFSMRQKPASPSGRGTGVAVLLLLPMAACLLQGCDRSTGDYEMREKINGYKGAARLNPWLAAQLMLERMGMEASTRVSLGRLPQSDTAIFMPLDAITSRGYARQLITWCQRGGHLIVGCNGTDRFYNDFPDDPLKLSVHELRGEFPLLEELNVEAKEKSADQSGLLDFDDLPDLAIKTKDHTVLDVSESDPDVLSGEKDSALLASYRSGTGRLTLLASASPFRNRWIGEGDHAEILHQIVNLDPVSAIVFVTSGKVNLWDMLMSDAWRPLAGTIVLILLWLWRHLPRFGPAIPADTATVRHFGTQLDEAGAFLSDRAGPGALLEGARRSVLHAAAQRGLQRGAPDFMEQLAARSGIPAAAVQRALTDDSGDRALIEQASVLQRLRVSVGVAV